MVLKTSKHLKLLLCAADIQLLLSCCR